MNKKQKYYNSLVHQDRQLSHSQSKWVSQFDCSDMKPLIICRGPIRKEVMTVWEEMGINDYGILLSEKDSITYNNALAPELRSIKNPDRVHRVPDYTGEDKEERTQRIAQIIGIAKENGHDSVFAGYGFMAEDEALVLALEQAGLNFIGPCSKTVRGAGAKDEAKRTALQNDVSTIPGIDNLTALTLLRKVENRNGLKALVDAFGFHISSECWDESVPVEVVADVVLAESYQQGIDLISMDDIAQEAILQVENVFRKYPENRVRLKAIGGGGGKGQRILPSPTLYPGEKNERINAAAKLAEEKLIEVLQEVKATGVGDNKNVLIELNIETTRHQEIQVIGNGQWCTVLGARDCSLQMHEQKLLEVSQTTEMLEQAILRAEADELADQVFALKADLKTLLAMEQEAERFSAAVGLDSLSTFECIVERNNHFFMEMNTRIQVEHRVSELCYGLKFVNPQNEQDYFVVESLVEVMTLLARHGKQLPKPERVPRQVASVEARLNATNAALKPHAGGVIEYWSSPLESEIRDDQGISMRNPDTGQFIKYHLAGAYDSNIALLLTVGKSRESSFEKMAELLRRTQISGENLSTNLPFHYGLVHWFLAENVHAKVATKFVMPYLAMAGRLKQEAQAFDLEFAFSLEKSRQSIVVREQYSDTDLSSALTAMNHTLERKHSLLLRPMETLLEDSHRYSGWLSMVKAFVKFQKNRIIWLKNPIEVLDETYHFLNMDYQSALPAAECIWKHDDDVLQTGLQFYRDLQERLQVSDWLELSRILQEGTVPEDIGNELWQQIQSAHKGFQMGMGLLNCLLYMAQSAQFYDLKLNSDLSIDIPDALLDEEYQKQMMKVLVPPPATKADELVAVCGGMFYGCEVPGAPAFVEEGAHVEAGDPIYIIEVMKMFNKITAPFACTIDKVLLQNVDGAIVKQGQPLFKITPDNIVEDRDLGELHEQRRVRTEKIVEAASS